MKQQERILVLVGNPRTPNHLQTSTRYQALFVLLQGAQCTTATVAAYAVRNNAIVIRITHIFSVTLEFNTVPHLARILIPRANQPSGLSNSYNTLS